MPIFDYICHNEVCTNKDIVVERMVDSSDEVVACRQCLEPTDIQLSCTAGIRANFSPRFHVRRPKTRR